MHHPSSTVHPPAPATRPQPPTGRRARARRRGGDLGTTLLAVIASVVGLGAIAIAVLGVAVLVLG